MSILDPRALTEALAAPPEAFRDALLAVTDESELHLLLMAICGRRDLLLAHVDDPVMGRRSLLGYVPEARKRCTTTPIPPKETDLS